jgi:hypothetical protein
MTATILPRSEGVSFPIPIQYRRPGDPGWCSGTVVNFVHADGQTDHDELFTQEGCQVLLVVPPEEYM